VATVFGVKGRRSGVLTAWTNAWLAGQCGTSDVVDAAETADPRRPRDAGHQVGGLAAFDAELVPLREVLIAWRRAGSAVHLVLPVAGDVRGLPGPAPFHSAALEAGEAVVGFRLGIVPRIVEYGPSSAATTVLWQAFALDPLPEDFIQLSDAQYDLTTVIRDSAEALSVADVSNWVDDLAEALHDARRAGEQLRLPPQSPSAAVALLAQAERLQAVLDIALSDPTGGAIDRAGIAARTAGLQPLITAVRRARIAAYNAGSRLVT
jgi:hypothetical protein